MIEKRTKMSEIKDLGIRRQRFGGLDMIRGIVLISMILYHLCWDLVYIYHFDFPWYESTGAYVWQQSICWTFIFLSGFCWSLGKHHLKRGLIVFGGGAVISLVTILLLPEDRVVFGILTFLGSSMLLMIPLKKWLCKIPAKGGLVLSLLCFLIFRNINIGYLGFEPWNFIKLPEFLYRGYVMTYLGFADAQFFSTDYFSLLPWFFLFLTGFYTYYIVSGNLRIMEKLQKGWEPFQFLGRHSLLIYMLHQPVIYGALWILYS